MKPRQPIVISSEPALRRFKGAGRREIPMMLIENTRQQEGDQPAFILSLRGAAFEPLCGESGRSNLEFRTPFRRLPAVLSLCFAVFRLLQISYIFPCIINFERPLVTQQK
jgi:hypothetical protein